MAWMLWPILFRALNRFGDAVSLHTPLKRPLDADTLIRYARKRTKLHNFGEPDVRVPLEILTRSLNMEADLSFSGHIMTRIDLVHLLINRLRIQADLARHPGIGNEHIERPIIIMGLPRSGTSLLHALLVQDPAHRAPLTWQVRRPSPPPMSSDSTPDSHIRKTARELVWFHRLNPRFKHIHAVGAQLPQECIEILSHTFSSTRFETTYFVPTYQSWLADQDITAAYGWHKRFLQHLQCGEESERWILKSSAHLFALDALLNTYPDAMVVQTHRDPCAAIGSMLDMTVELQRIFSDRRDSGRVAPEVARWAKAMERAMQIRARAEQQSGTVFVDIYYTELASSPLETVERIYHALGLTLTPEARSNMRTWIAHHPQHRHGVHRYSLDDFRVDANEIAGLFRNYLHSFYTPSAHPRTNVTRQRNLSTD